MPTSAESRKTWLNQTVNSYSILPLLVPCAKCKKGHVSKTRCEQRFSSAQDDWQIVSDYKLEVHLAQFKSQSSTLIILVLYIMPLN
jgi:hypothetical protein